MKLFDKSANSQDNSWHSVGQEIKLSLNAPLMSLVQSCTTEIEAEPVALT